MKILNIAYPICLKKVIQKINYFVYPKGDLKKCKLCQGNGKIYVYRSDIEDFDEILCPECRGKKKQKNEK